MTSACRLGVELELRDGSPAARYRMVCSPPSSRQGPGRAPPALAPGCMERWNAAPPELISQVSPSLGEGRRKPATEGGGAELDELPRYVLAETLACAGNATFTRPRGRAAQNLETIGIQNIDIFGARRALEAQDRDPVTSSPTEPRPYPAGHPPVGTVPCRGAQPAPAMALTTIQNRRKAFVGDHRTTSIFSKIEAGKLCLKTSFTPRPDPRTPDHVLARPPTAKLELVGASSSPGCSDHRGTAVAAPAGTITCQLSTPFAQAHVLPSCVPRPRTATTARSRWIWHRGGRLPGGGQQSLAKARASDNSPSRRPVAPA